MKRLMSLILMLTLVLTISACGAKPSNNENVNDVVSGENNSDAEWKQFINEYEEWVDEYIEITKKYKSNQSDLSILGDYTKMMNELVEWAGKTEEMEKELKEASPAELTEYSAELARIAAKLAKAAN